MSGYLEIASRLAVAGLVGLAIGMEREWSGHASGPAARFAGARTFLLLGFVGGVSGWLLGGAAPAAGLVLLAGGAGLAIAAYVMAALHTQRVDGTTETAALVVLGLGTAAGLGQLEIAGGAAAVVVLALAEKTRIHGFVQHIGEQEMRATLYFAVLALVVLPVLPPGPYGPLGGIRPRTLWAVVLMFCALNFAGYLARRAAGERRGYAITGLLGGLVSSTAVTLSFSRKSREEPALGPALALGVVAACTVLLLRVLVITLLLGAALVPPLALYFLPPFVIGASVVALSLGRRRREVEPPPVPPARNPLGFVSSVQMALAFQIVLMAVFLARTLFGTAGVLGSAAVLGLADVDALTYSMIQLARDRGLLGLAAEAIAIAVLANTLVKLALALGVGTGPFRRLGAWGLGLLGLGSVIGILIAR
jgi:uncharacterized membrane protein (DUF4010 family)